MKFIKLKHNFLSLLIISLFGVMFMASCGDDDDPVINPDPIAEDGIYIVGESTAYIVPNIKALFKTTRNEVLQETRSELLEIYVAVGAGSAGFRITEVSGSTTTNYGPGADFAMVAADDLNQDEPKNGLWKGNLVENSNVFTVPSDGLYHVIMDTEVKKVAIAKVDWGVIGGASPGGWSDNTPMTNMESFNDAKMTFTATDVLMLENDWKFRYSNGWKIILDEEYDLGDGQKGIKVNCNFGDAVDNLVPGGANISNTDYGVYEFTMTWETGKDFIATQTRTGDGPELAEYPENLYMIGGAIGGWNWTENDIQMLPVHSHPELFWRIVWMKDGEGIKFAPGQEWVGDFGGDGDFVDGVKAQGSDNIDTPNGTGYYMVVANMEDKTIEVIAPQVFLLGDCVGNWDAGANGDNIMTVDNDATAVTVSRDLAAGDLRLYAAASTLKCDWWQAEFIVLNNVIEFRGTGDDQERANLTAGNYNISLNFVDNTGTIE